MDWTVACKPVDGYSEKNGTNLGGLKVVLISDNEEIEISRVAFARTDSRNPKTKFADQLQDELGKAQEAADVLNEALDNLERARAEERLRARERVQEILGDRMTEEVLV